jgi:hypothetical protein
MQFVGKSLAMSADGLAKAATDLSVGTAEIAAVFSVETHGAGFLPDRRPQILFERHVFSRLTGGKYDATNPDISAPTPGGYGNSGAPQHDRLAQALLLDREAALSSASWGLAQVMGENYGAAGFDSVEDMVATMCDLEDAQLAGMASFIKANGMAGYLATHNWSAFARRYNGPNYATNRYDIQLNGFYQKYLVSAIPDLQVRAAQIYLQFRGIDCHGIDGVLGSATLDAIKTFQSSAGIPPTGSLDTATLQALLPV